MSNITLLAILLSVIIVFICYKIFDKIIFPNMVYKGMIETDRNPKWVISQLQYYGFDDIDIVLCKSKWGMLPRFRAGKNGKLEMWIDDETSIQDIEEIGRLALIGKIKIQYNLWFPNKPLHWLSILLYMLNGGDIQIANTDDENNKPLD